VRIQRTLALDLIEAIVYVGGGEGAEVVAAAAGLVFAEDNTLGSVQAHAVLDRIEMDGAVFVLPLQDDVVGLWRELGCRQIDDHGVHQLPFAPFGSQTFWVEGFEFLAFGGALPGLEEVGPCNLRIRQNLEDVLAVLAKDHEG
jgi:hypothetical protein